MRAAIFSCHQFDRECLAEANGARRHDLQFFDARLTPAMCVLAEDCPTVCAFVNDRLDQAFFTREALRGTAETTFGSIDAFERGEPSGHEIV